MGKGTIYALPRNAGRFDKAEYARALELFKSNGIFSGDAALVAYVVTYCFDRQIPFKWSDIQASGYSIISRERD